MDVVELSTDRLCSSVLLRARNEAAQFSQAEGRKRERTAKQESEAIIVAAQPDIRGAVKMALDDGIAWNNIEEHMVLCLRESMTTGAKRLRTPSPRRRGQQPIGSAETPAKAARASQGGA